MKKVIWFSPLHPVSFFGQDYEKKSLELVTNLFEFQNMFTKIPFLVWPIESGNCGKKRKKNSKPKCPQSYWNVFYLSVLEYFVFQIFYRKFWSIYLSFSHLTLVQNFALCDCLRSSYCNFCWKFSIIGSNSGLKFSCKVFSLYLSQDFNILI